MNKGRSERKSPSIIMHDKFPTMAFHKNSSPLQFNIPECHQIISKSSENKSSGKLFKHFSFTSIPTQKSHLKLMCLARMWKISGRRVIKFTMKLPQKKLQTPWEKKMLAIKQFREMEMMMMAWKVREESHKSIA